MRPIRKLYRLRIAVDAAIGSLVLRRFPAQIIMLKAGAYVVKTENYGLLQRVPVKSLMQLRNGNASDSSAYFCREIICLHEHVAVATGILRTAIEEEMLMRKKHLQTMVSLWQGRFIKPQLVERTNEQKEFIRSKNTGVSLPSLVHRQPA